MTIIDSKESHPVQLAEYAKMKIGSIKILCDIYPVQHDITVRKAIIWICDQMIVSRGVFEYCVYLNLRHMYPLTVCSVSIVFV